MRNPSTSGSKSYDQNIVGTALSWKPDNWTTFGGGYYHDFLTTKKADVNNYSPAMRVSNTGRLYRAGWPVRGEIGDAVLYGRSHGAVTGRNYQRQRPRVTVRFIHGPR